MIWVVVIGVLAGIISGMGIGGGTILIPAIIFLQDINQHQAQGINLIYFVPTAVIALITHGKNHRLEKKVITPIALIGLIGAAAGAFLAVHIEADILKRIFGGFLLLMGLSEVFKKDKHRNTTESEEKQEAIK